MVVTVQLWFKGTLNRKQVTVTSRLMDMRKADKSQRGREKVATILSEQIREGDKIKKIKSSQTESKKTKKNKTKENMFLILYIDILFCQKN